MAKHTQQKKKFFPSRISKTGLTMICGNWFLNRSGGLATEIFFNSRSEMIIAPSISSAEHVTASWRIKLSSAGHLLPRSANKQRQSEMEWKKTKLCLWNVFACLHNWLCFFCFAMIAGSMATWESQIRLSSYICVLITSAKSSDSLCTAVVNLQFKPPRFLLQKTCWRTNEGFSERVRRE